MVSRVLLDGTEREKGADQKASSIASNLHRGVESSFLPERAPLRGSPATLDQVLPRAFPIYANLEFWFGIL